MKEITIIDYGMSNLGSVLNMFKRINVPAKISSDINVINNSEKILLPGVGAFDTAMERIQRNNFLEILNHKALVDKIPILGICLGMQLLTNKSEEGELPGLGWIDGETIKFKFNKELKLKVPHMGWNIVKETNKSPLIENFAEMPRFYFVHSYYVLVAKHRSSLMKAYYGNEFDAVITNGTNIFGAQFHPEKSHKFGMQLFKNFAEL
jgi:glutamine amidotransferase